MILHNHLKMIFIVQVKFMIYYHTICASNLEIYSNMNLLAEASVIRREEGIPNQRSQMSDDKPQNLNLLTYHLRKPSQFDYELEVRNQRKMHLDYNLFKKNQDKNEQIKLFYENENSQDYRQCSGFNHHNSESISIMNQNSDGDQVQNLFQNQIKSSKELISSEISESDYISQEDLKSKHSPTEIFKKLNQKNKSRNLNVRTPNFKKNYADLKKHPIKDKYLCHQMTDSIKNYISHLKTTIDCLIDSSTFSKSMTEILDIGNPLQSKSSPIKDSIPLKKINSDSRRNGSKNMNCVRHNTNNTKNKKNNIVSTNDKKEKNAVNPGKYTIKPGINTMNHVESIIDTLDFQNNDLKRPKTSRFL